jgi:alkylation response protein AidB-like acyl-CoA dehydrogenase
MDFSFSEEQEMLRSSARDFLLKECPKSKVRELEEDEKGYDPEIWHKMLELGWMGLVFPEEYGGVNGDFMDLVILMEEMGRNILPGPFFPTVALCALPILEYGTSSQKAKILPKIAGEGEIWTLALTESSATYKASGIELYAAREDEDYLLEGTKFFVPDAHIADHFLVVARTSEEENPEEGITVFLVDAKIPGIKVEVIPTIAHDKQCEVKFDKVRVPKDSVLGEVGWGWKIVNFILQRATILKCAEILGGAQAVLEMTNAYAKERIQFDRPIGSFQVIQHKLVDRFIDVEALKYLVYEAAWGISTGSPSDLQISITKAKANEVFQRVCIDGIKCHGAIGFTIDHDIGLYYRRIRAAEFFLGSTNFHREKIATELGL